MQIRRILVGTDFSSEAEIATQHAANLARHTGAELVLLHAGNLPDQTRDVPTASNSAAEIDRLALAQLSEDQDRLEELRAQLSEDDLEVTAQLVDTFPDTGICDAAVDLNVDLVVTGTHGRSGITRFLLGSVAERVVRSCKRASMVVRKNHDGAGGFPRVLVPTDFSELAEHALEFAFTVAAEGATIELLHCWQLPPTAGSYELEPLVQSLLTEVGERGEELLENNRRDGYHLEFHALRDAPAQGIQVRLEQEPFDVIVMGSHGRRGLSRFLLGSVAEATVRHAPCSVIVVPSP